MSGKCLVLMPFKDPFNDYYKKILVPAIEAAGYTPIRADEIYGTGPIIEDIFREIRESSVLLADVTEKNPNVNYELGIAHALKKPVVIVSKAVEDIPFDYRHLRAIIYDVDEVGGESSLRDKIFNTLKTIEPHMLHAHFASIIAELREIVSLKQVPFTTIVEQVHESLQTSYATLYPTREDAYVAATKTIARVRDNQQEKKHLLLTALHGHDGKKRAEPSYTNKAFDDFDKILFECETSSGLGMWHVREIYNVADEKRLKKIEKSMESVNNAEGYEVRAFCLKKALPQLTPLIIGNEDTFIGLDDPHYYRIDGAIHVHGKSFVEFATKYFNSLWEDDRNKKLRSGVGMDDEEIEKLRAKIRNSAEETDDYDI